MKTRQVLAAVVAAVATVCALGLDGDAVKVVTYGSTIKLEHVASKHRLHSHKIAYGSGSGQQSVTGFPDGGDPGSFWVIKGAHRAVRKVAGAVVQCGDTIRLQHLATGNNLHSHEHRAPMNRDYEVSAYADESSESARWRDGDTGDNWIVDCTTKGSWKRFEEIRLHHADTDTYLTSSTKLKFGHPIEDQLQVSSAGRKNKQSLWKTNEGFYLAPPRAKKA